MSPPGYSLEFESILGEGVIEDSRRIIAISETGDVAVYEPGSCRITVIGLRTRSLKYRTGRCGGGPGEFRDVIGMTYLGSELLTWDAGKQKLVTIDSTGRIVASRSVDAVTKGDIRTLEHLSAVKPNALATMVVARRPGQSLVSLIDRQTGNVIRSFLSDVAFVQAHPRTAFSLGVYVCGADWPVGPTVLVAGSWEFEALAFSADGQLRWSSMTPISWLHSTEFEGKEMPSAMVRRPICGSSGVMLRAIRTAPSAPINAPWTGGFVEFRDDTGGILLQSEVSEGAEALMGRGASWQDYWVFEDPKSEKPRLQVFRLVHHRNSGQSPIVLGPSITH